MYNVWVQVKWLIYEMRFCHIVQCMLENNIAVKWLSGKHCSSLVMKLINVSL